VSWQRVRGHDALVESFQRAWRRGRLAHAYLFTGPAGVGKHLFATELAKALLCEAPPGGRLEGCDRCPGCVQVEAGTHPDFVAAARPEESLEFPIAVMREFCDKLALKPARGRGKVAVLDDADDLNEESANCFLKTLEEPPPRSLLVLVGTSAERQLPTIVSRCQAVRFAPLPEDVVADLLRQGGVGDEALVRRLVRLSGGSPGLARSLADPALWEFRQALVTELSRPRPDGVTLARQLTEFVEEAGKESSAQRKRAALVLKLFVEFLNDALRVALGGVPRLAEPQEEKPLRELARRVEPERLLDVLEQCLDSDEHIDRRVQLVLALEAWLDAVGQRLSAG
jgi:DNA polymerase-3 subunit delta'